MFLFQVIADARLELSAYVYNKRVADWEPLIEPSENILLNKFKRWETIVKASLRFFVLGRGGGGGGGREGSVGRVVMKTLRPQMPLC